MMRQLLLSLGVLTAGACLAAPLTPEEALARLDNNPLNGPSTRAATSIIPLLEVKTQKGEPALYVFENRDNPGFMLLSADDMTPALLGFSDFNNFDPDNVPPAMEAWLGQYQRQIEYLRNLNLKESVSEEAFTRTPTLPDWAPIAPMIKTAWDQGSPYNSLCPKQSGQATYTGCVATAMAQVMKYFEYPAKGQGSITYRCESLNRNLSLDFSDITFQWNLMLDKYAGNFNDAQANAVAELMQAAGYAVQMSYGTSTSGAVSTYIPGALIKYFNYDNEAIYLARSMYEYTEWATMLYNNLKEIGPVIYDGDTDFSGGHSFVCDGYQGDGYFHFNWGWSGSGDGYFLLDALTPSVVGSGAYASGFNFEQDMVLNVRKPQEGSKVEDPKIVLSGTVQAYTSGADLYVAITGSQLTGFRNFGIEKVNVTVGLQMLPANNLDAEPVYYSAENKSLQDAALDPAYVIFCDGTSRYPFPKFTLSALNLTDGVKYKATMAYKLANTDWMPTGQLVGDYPYFYITKNGSNYEIDNFETMEFKCENFEFLTPVYDGSAVKINLTIANPYEIELTRGTTLMLLDAAGNIAYLGDSFTETLSPGGSLTKEWISPLKRQISGTLTSDTEYYPALFDIGTQTYYYKAEEPVVMSKNPGSPQFSANLVIDNEEIKGGVYQIANSSNFQATLKINVTKGYFSYPVKIWVMENEGGNYYSLLAFSLGSIILNGGEQYLESTKINFPSADIGVEYYLGAVFQKADGGYSLLNSRNILPFVALDNGAGIEELGIGSEDIFYIHDRSTGILSVAGSGISNVEVYSLNGMRLPARVDYLGDIAEVDLSSLGKGMVIVKATDSKGKTKSGKLAL
ncbi:MAG: thiol protease/hemagglutinin PrtT [Muribaculaceae bacterium]|nr:thiol protease/hemagglutinin PrtT [Muribaculaceae bacterium]